MEERERTVLETAAFVINYMDKFLVANQNQKQGAAFFPSTSMPTLDSIRNTTGEMPWKPLNGTVLMLNIDAALDLATKTLGVGAIVRDSQGHVIAGLSKPVQGCFRSDKMEAKALFHSLNWVVQEQLHITHIETNALRLSNALNYSLTDLSCFSDLIMDIRCLLSFFFEAAISHVRRYANQATHGLAKHALELDQDSCWIGEISYPIFTIVVNDS
uniref:RNase H type-1 domain-containing protein n=1 Tax=Cannabis sativa TaxID=3483 RepID=A0A803PVF4_CANSA